MIFYVPDIFAKEIENPHSAHMFSMRVRYKDKLVITDLQGNYAKVQIKHVDKKNKLISYHLRKAYTRENTNSGVLIQALPDKLYLEKLVEVAALQGMKEIIFFYSERSVRQKLKEDRLQRIILRACELSEHYWAPTLTFIEESELDEYLDKYKPVVLEQVDESDSNPQTSNNQTILVGPEGGWSSSEIEKFKTLGLPFHSMGEVVYPAWLAGFAYFERNKRAV